MAKFKLTNLHLVVLGLSVYFFLSVSVARLIGYSLVSSNNLNESIQNTNAQEVLGSITSGNTQTNKDYKYIELPDEFPSNFPQYPESKLENVWISTASGSLGISAVWHINNTNVASVSSFFEEQLIENKWSANTVLKEGGGSTITFGKENINGYLGIVSDNNNVVVSSVLDID